MPVLDTFCRSATAPATTRKAYGEAADDTSEEATAGDDFSQLMEQAIAPATEKKTSGKSTGRQGGVTSGQGRLHQAQTPTDADSVQAEAATPTTTANPLQTSGAEQHDTAPKTVAPAAETKASDPASPAQTPTITEPLPVFLALPLAGYFGANPGLGTPATGNSGGPETILPTLALATAATAMSGLAAGGEAPTTPNLNTAAATQPPAGEPAAAGNNALLKTLAAATDAQPTDATESRPTLPSAGETSQEKAPAPVLAALDLISSKEKLPVGMERKAVEKDGTGVALTDSPMKKNENTNKVAELDVKVLPGSVTELAREKNLPPHLVVAPPNAAENRVSDLNVALPTERMATAETARAVNMVDLPSLSDARVRALERTQDMVSLHAMRLVESKSDSLHVTIKPAVGTELSLELRERNGVIEAHATLQRGDFPLMNQHWTELQQRLEQRGIKLDALDGEANFLANDRGSSKQQAAQEEAASHASAFAEFASVGHAGGASARLATDYDGWESWA